MRCICFFIVFNLLTIWSIAQQNIIDSLKQALSRTSDDSTRFCLFVQLGELYTFNNADSSIYYIKQAASLAEKKNNALWKAHAYYAVSLYFYIASDFASALHYAFKNHNEYEQYQDSYVLALSTHMLSITYIDNGYHKEGLAYLLKTINLLDTIQYRNKMYNIHYEYQGEDISSHL